MVSKEILIGYINQDLSTEEIGGILGVTGRAVRYWLKKYSLETNVRLAGYDNLDKHRHAPKRRTRSLVTKECEVCSTEFSCKKSVESIRRFCSISCKNKWQSSLTGESHWNYTGKETRGNQTKRNWKDYKEFKKAVHTRDRGRCVICDKTGKLDAHHIHPWSVEDLRFDIDNGISLCRVCHRELHKLCGQRNYTSEKFHKNYVKTSAGWKRTALATF